MFSFYSFRRQYKITPDSSAVIQTLSLLSFPFQVVRDGGHKVLEVA
jgi:hypothetical protein